MMDGRRERRSHCVFAHVPGGRFVMSVHHPAMTGPLVEVYFKTQHVLDAIINELVAANFSLRRLIEPQLPAAHGASAHEQRLATRPWFLIVESVRR